MSTTVPTTTAAESSSTSPPSPTSSHADSDTAALYLFTFLATILILVLLSASLVLRSYVLRRRYRRRLQQALADGLFADLENGTIQFDVIGGYRRTTRRLGPKPVVFDTWIHPADKDDTWPSITPVAVRCSPPQPSISPPTLPSRPPFLSQLRIPGPFSLSSRPSSPLSRQGQSPNHSPGTASSTRTPPTPSISPDPSTHTETDATTLTVCVLVAMPDPSSPVHRRESTVKGKSAQSQAHQQKGDVDPLLPPSLRRSSDTDGGLPLLEFGVAEVSTEDWECWT